MAKIVKHLLSLLFYKMDIQLETVDGEMKVKYITYLAFTNGTLGGKHQSIFSVFTFSLPEFLHLRECVVNGISGNIGDVSYEYKMDQVIFRTNNTYNHIEQTVSISQFMTYANKIVNSTQDIADVMQNLVL